MRDKHRSIINRLKEIYKGDERYLALIVIGSIANNSAREDSDIDICLVASEKEFKRISKDQNYFIGNTDLIKEDEIEIDGKVISLEYLRQVSIKGSEPTRASFDKALTVFDHSGKVQTLIDRIEVYPENERESKLNRFYSLFEFNQYYCSQAIETDNHYLKQRCLLDSIFYASRLVLTYNRILFSCHKSMFTDLEKAKHMPIDFINISKELLERPTSQKLDSYFDLISSYFSEFDSGLDKNVGLILENEWAWYTGKLPLSDI